MNSENLKPNSKRTPSELRRNAQKGGVASGKARKEKKMIKEALLKALSSKYTIDDIQLKGYDAIAVSMMKQALRGDVSAFREIRDTIGEKPSDKLELDSNDITGIKVRFVDKSMASTRKEKDPKIVGDYTPPIGSDDEG